MRNKLFFSSLIIMGIIFTGMNGALGITQDIGFSVPDLLSIERNPSSVLSSTATVSGINTLTLDSPITFTYNITNADSNTTYVYNKATYEADGTTYYSAIRSNGIIAFSKSNGTGEGEIVWPGNTLDNNKNIIAFSVICPQLDYDDIDKIRDIVIPNPEHDFWFQRYRLSPGETKEISCTISGDAVDGTFGMNDEPGEYKATVTITTTAPSF